MSNFFPELVPIRFGLIKLFAGAVGLALCFVGTIYLKIDGYSAQNGPLDTVIILTPLIVLWTVITSLAARRPVWKWLADFWDKNRFPYHIAYLLQDSTRNVLNPQKDVSKLLLTCRRRDSEAMVILSLGHGGQNLLMIRDENSISDYIQIPLKNVTKHTDSEPLLVVNHKENAWDNAEFSFTMTVDDLLRHAKLLKYGTQWFLNHILYEREDLLNKNKEVIQKTISDLFATKRFGNEGSRGLQNSSETKTVRRYLENHQNSNEAKVIRQNLEHHLIAIDEITGKFTIPLGKRF